MDEKLKADHIRFAMDEELEADHMGFAGGSMAFLSSFCSLFDCVNLDKQCLARHWHAQCLNEANHTTKGHEVILGDEEEMEEGRRKLIMDSCTFINKYSELVKGQLGWPFGQCI